MAAFEARTGATSDDPAEAVPTSRLPAEKRDEVYEVLRQLDPRLARLVVYDDADEGDHAGDNVAEKSANRATAATWRAKGGDIHAESAHLSRDDRAALRVQCFWRQYRARRELGVRMMNAMLEEQRREQARAEQWVDATFDLLALEEARREAETRRLLDGMQLRKEHIAAIRIQGFVRSRFGDKRSERARMTMTQRVLADARALQHAMATHAPAPPEPLPIPQPPPPNHPPPAANPISAAGTDSRTRSTSTGIRWSEPMPRSSPLVAKVAAPSPPRADPEPVHASMALAQLSDQISSNILFRLSDDDDDDDDGEAHAGEEDVVNDAR